MLVLGKPIAGGLPAAVYGISAEVAARAAALLALAGVPDSPEHRAELGDTFDQVAQLVRAAASKPHQGAFA